MSIIFVVSCSSSAKNTPVDMPEWLGKTRAEVKEHYSHLTPKTEENKITYRDSDPLPSPARCSVIPCWPFTGQGIRCQYVFKFKNELVVKATKEGRCRITGDDRKD